MPLAQASIVPRFDHVRRLAGRLPALACQLYDDIARGSDARVHATVTLLAVTVSAALAFALSPQRPAPATQPPVDARASAAEAIAPVKIVGAAPRGASCAEQVWPYIEQRCLTRAADRPKPNLALQNAAPDATAPQPSPRATTGAAPDATAPQPSPRATTGAAPADRAASAQPVAAERAPRPRVATAYLPLARPRIATIDPDSLPIPPGAVPVSPGTWRGGRISIWRDEEDAWADRAMEGPLAGEPRRRVGRRAHRFRHGPFWGRGNVLGFPF